MHLNFSGQRVLVLGASSDLGLALVDLLRTQGLEVMPTYCSPGGHKKLTAKFPDLSAYVLDWGGSNPGFLESVLQKPVHYLVDLAHAEHEALLAASSLAPAQEYLQTQISGRLPLVKAVARQMLAQRFGRLIHVSSIAAGLPAPGQGFYAMAKTAVEAMYLTLGVEMGQHGLTSLNLRLGLVDAGRGHRFLKAQKHKGAPSPPLVTQDQVAQSLCFLLSDAALAMTCTTIVMDAGATAIKYA